MKTRVITGTCYVAVLVVCFLLKIFVSSLFFDVFLYACAIIGTKEIVDAMGERLTGAQRGIVYAFTIINVPACALFEYFFGVGLHVTAILFFFLALVLLSLFVIRHDETTPENIGTAFFCTVYPSLIFIAIILANHIGSDAVAASLTSNHIGSDNALKHLKIDSVLAIAFIFASSAISDTFAFMIGSIGKKRFPKKLAPTISPNKTVIGFLGGVLGGIVTGIVMYFVYNAICGIGYADMALWLPVYAVIGVVGAVSTAFGDLVESCIKRRLGIKDMGKILPGHGGILDRLDGTIFAGIFIYLAFVLIHVIAAAVL
ncbi:MAG: CDP-archaeol synthase [Clostridia bacterium]|nr:CDP-archaeol synthase [Clostridia bacterium]